MRSPLPVLTLVSVAAVACGGAGSAPTADPGGTGPGSAPFLQGCAVFPADNPWNRDVSRRPRGPALGRLHRGHERRRPRSCTPTSAATPPTASPGPPCPAASRACPWRSTTHDESDPGPYPFPRGRARGGRAATATSSSSIATPAGSTRRSTRGSWARAGAAARARSSTCARTRCGPDGWTSADAAGLPILPGLVRRDEVLAGEIRHALRFTVRRTQRALRRIRPRTSPAADTDPDLPPMGLRVRLKASYDLGAVPRRRRASS